MVQDEPFELVDIVKRASICQSEARIYWQSLLPTTLLGKCPVMVTPSADNIEIFQSEARWVDLYVAGCAGLDVAMFVKLLTDLARSLARRLAEAASFPP